jgi:rhodanese-related sulfurtransferase
MLPSITRQELLIAIYDGVVTVVDALPAAPFALRHICSAINLPAEDAGRHAYLLLPDKDTPIVTYSTDAECGRGEMLAACLAELGYSNVRVYREGIEGWIASDMPVEWASRSAASSADPDRLSA